MPIRHISIRLPTPRLLPVTILLMGVLLAVKSGHLIFPATAETGTAHAQPAKPAEHHAPQGSPSGSAKPDAVASAPGVKADAPAQAGPPALKLPSEPPVTESERALLTDIRQRRVALDVRESAIAAREVTFLAVEKRLATRFDELSSLQKRLENLERQRMERDEGSWRGLVKLYESMKPRDAAVIFNDLDPSVLIPVFDRMKENKAAAIMSAMLPDRARQVTIELASYRKKANAEPAATDVDRARPAQAGG